MKKQVFSLSKMLTLSSIVFSAFVFMPALSMASVSGDSIYTVVDRAPKFNGQPSRTQRFLEQNLTYPDQVWQQGIEGVVKVSFTITRDGHLIDAKVDSGVDPLLDLEALRVVDLMTDWKPAKKNGENVHSRVSVPVIFSLSDEEKDFISTMERMGLDQNLPLYVIDNKKVRSRIHLPSYNVKSLRVLKGQAAIDQYGDEGANGVVIISTKRGTEPVR
jgi:TonB family protein